MAKISVEHIDNTTVFRVAGVLTFDRFVAAVKEYYPAVTGNIVWDFSASNLDGITTGDLTRLPPIAKLYMVNRVSGKTAFVSPDADTRRLLNVYVIIADISCIQFANNVFEGLEAALRWLSE